MHCAVCSCACGEEKRPVRGSAGSALNETSSFGRLRGERAYPQARLPGSKPTKSVLTSARSADSPPPWISTPMVSLQRISQPLTPDREVDWIRRPAGSWLRFRDLTDHSATSSLGSPRSLLG